MGSSIQNVRGLSFDLDDTLYDNKPVIRNAFLELYHHLLKHYPKIASKYNFDDFLHAAKSLRRQYPLEADLGKLRRMHINQVILKSGYQSTITSSANKEAYNIFWQARQKVKLFPDVLQILKTLSTQLPLVSISNGNACTKTIGIDNYLQHSINAIDTGKAKPDSSMFLLACEKLDIEPVQLVHIGDNLDLDVKGAVNAGCRSIWLNWFDQSTTDNPANIVIDKLSELLDIEFN